MCRLCKIYLYTLSHYIHPANIDRVNICNWFKIITVHQGPYAWTQVKPANLKVAHTCGTGYLGSQPGVRVPAEVRQRFSMECAEGWLKLRLRAMVQIFDKFVWSTREKFCNTIKLTQYIFLSS